MSDPAKLSRMLFEARESIEMYADIVENRTGKPVPQVRRLIAEIDEYRRDQGWSAHGFGGEQPTPSAST